MTAAPPAGAWRRYAAYSLDVAILAVPVTGATWSRLVGGWEETTRAARQLADLVAQLLADALLQGATPVQLVAGLLDAAPVRAAIAAVQDGITHMLAPWLCGYVLLAALYHVGFERSRWQGSPGKHALGLRVVDASDDRVVSLAQTLVRHLAGALSWLTLNLGHALALVPPQRRTLHDYLARVRVVGPAAQRLPAWARGWLALQLLGAAVVAGWLLQRYLIALQASLG